MQKYSLDWAIKFDTFVELCSQSTSLSHYPLAASVDKNILIYDGQKLKKELSNHNTTVNVQMEWFSALKDGPGVFVIKRAFSDLSVVDRQTQLFHRIIKEEKTQQIGKGDHFGNNERIWNAFQKSCYRDANAFIEYYGNPFLAQACLAWLGPGYQITAQVNNVKPGSNAQMPHRDYHLGFQSSAIRSRFPMHVHEMSQFLTLQGAIAHTDMPVESGPTKLLPFSQSYSEGYLSYERSEFVSFFEEKHVQLPLEKGDMVFFNPALFHGAGANNAGHDRLANLVQVSSPFGRPMESLNRRSMILSVYPTLLKRFKEAQCNTDELDNAISAVASGYSFPTNLDLDPPVDGNAPQTEQQLLKESILKQWTMPMLELELDKMIQRRQA